MSPYKLQLEDTFEIINGERKYDYNSCLAYIYERGKDIFASNFIINPLHNKIYFKLLIYAINDQYNLDRQELDPKKGLLLIGDSGVGKTAMMHLSKTFFPKKRQYLIKSCKAISNEFSHKGFESLMPLLVADARPLCLDNLGREPVAKYFGTNCDTVNTIVEFFYEQQHTSLTPKLHITTNLTPTEIENRYGVEFRKMLQTLFNVVICD